MRHLVYRFRGASRASCCQRSGFGHHNRLRAVAAFSSRDEQTGLHQRGRKPTIRSKAAIFHHGPAATIVGRALNDQIEAFNGELPGGLPCRNGGSVG